MKGGGIEKKGQFKERRREGVEREGVKIEAERRDREEDKKVERKRRGKEYRV